MDDRRALLEEWVEEEGERQRRPLFGVPQGSDQIMHGWIQVGICAVCGALAAGILVCGLVEAWNQAGRVSCIETLREVGFHQATGDLDGPEWPLTRWANESGTAGIKLGELVVFLCVIVFRIAIRTVISALFLLAACALYNKLAGGNGSLSSVPELLPGKAMGIMLVTTLVHLASRFVIGLLLGAGRVDGRDSAVMAQLLSLAVSLVVVARMSSALLPTTFERRFLVALCYVLVVLFVIVVLAALFGALFLVVSVTG